MAFKVYFVISIVRFLFQISIVRFLFQFSFNVVCACLILVMLGKGVVTPLSFLRLGPLANPVDKSSKLAARMSSVPPWEISKAHTRDHHHDDSYHVNAWDR